MESGPQGDDPEMHTGEEKATHLFKRTLSIRTVRLALS